MTSLGMFAFSSKAYMPMVSRDHRNVITDAAQVLADNLRSLMSQHADMKTQAKVAKRASMDQRTVGRILNKEHSPTLKQIDGLASAFGLLPWQLLVPNLDATNPPTVFLTQAERDLYKRLAIAAEGIAKYAPITDPKPKTTSS